MSKIYPGDIVSTPKGEDVRVLVYDLVDKYYFVNQYGEVATCSFSSLDEVEAYMSQDHPENKADKYPGRTYHVTGRLADAVALNTAQTYDFTSELIALMLRRVAEYGFDKRLHTAANIGVVTAGDRIIENDHSFPSVLLGGIVESIRMSVVRELQDRGVDPSSVEQEELANLRDAVTRLLITCRAYELDFGDLYADIIGTCVGTINSCLRELEYMKEK